MGMGPVGEGSQQMSLHLVLLTVSCCALAVSAAGSPLAGLTADLRRAQRLSLMVAGALVIGNAACLLPDTPRWYSVLVTVLTGAGLVWSAMSVFTAQRTARSAAASQRGEGRHLTLAHVSQQGAATENALSTVPRPHLALLPGGRHPEYGAAASRTPSAGPTVVQAHPVAYDWDEDLDWDEVPTITRHHLDTVGHRGARAADVYVAQEIDTYAAPGDHRRTLVRRAHADRAALRSRVQAAYDGTTPAPRPRGTRI